MLPEIRFGKYTYQTKTYINLNRSDKFIDMKFYKMRLYVGFNMCITQMFDVWETLCYHKPQK